MREQTSSVSKDAGEPSRLDDNRSQAVPALERARAQLGSDRSWLWRSSPLRPIHLRYLLIVIVLCGLAWRITRYALSFPIWDDEAFVAVNFLQRDFVGMLDPLLYGQIVPLGFMWAELAISKVLGVSDLALRLLPFLSGVAALLLFWRFALTALPQRAAFLAVSIFAAAYYTVRHAAEVKPYATDLLLSLGLMMLGWSVYTHPRSVWRWVPLIALAALSVWCSYPAVFVGGAVGLLLTVRLYGERRAGLLAGWATYGVVLVASFGTMYLIYGHPHAQYASQLTEIEMWAKTFPPIVEFWKFPLWFVYMHLGNMLAYPVGGTAPASVVTFVLVVIGSVRLWRANRPLLLLLLGPLALTFLAAVLHKYPYGGSARTTQYLAPAFCLLAGLGLFATLDRFLAGPRLNVSVRLAGVLCAVIAIGGIVQDVLRPFKSEAEHRSRQAVLFVAERTEPDDRWVVFNATEEVPYAPYLGDWRGVGAQFVFDALRFSPGPVEWAPPPGSVQAAPGESIWLLAYRGAKIDFPEEQFEAYLSAVTRNLGAPDEHHSFRIREKRGRVESLEAYLFPAR